MINLITEKKSRHSFRKLLIHLHDFAFEYELPMDENRAIDGTELRHRFGYFLGYSNKTIDDLLDMSEKASVLEVMIALSIRCEENIMDDPDVGNRTSKWFWDMVYSLGLGDMYDTKYNSHYVTDILMRFNNRDYSENGEGSLFTVTDTTRDMRDLEIWYQMCQYLNELLNNKRRE